MITSHILNISTGKPAEGMDVTLFFKENDDWKEFAKAASNSDGRIKDWLTKIPTGGIYKLHFETKEYFKKNSIETFYPFVEIIFEIKEGQHYHVPLLISPFGYSTYRGS